MMITKNIPSLKASLEEGTLAEQRKGCVFFKTISGKFISNTLWHHLMSKPVPDNTNLPLAQNI